MRSDADEFFAERGFSLRVEQRDLDDRLPKYANSRGSTHWVDQVSIRTGKVVAESYSSGMSVDEAKARARKRYIEEEG